MTSSARGADLASWWWNRAAFRKETADVAAQLRDCQRRLTSAAGDVPAAPSISLPDESVAGIYEQRHLQPQREIMEEGERLCRQFAELGATARSDAAEAENQIAAFFGRQQEFESSAAETLSALEAAGQLTTRSHSEAAPLQGGIDALSSSISTSTEDPGWTALPPYREPARNLEPST